MFMVAPVSIIFLGDFNYVAAQHSRCIRRVKSPCVNLVARRCFYAMALAERITDALK
jgi:hypothetical protein